MFSTYPIVIVHQGAPVQQIEHGLVAEQGLLSHAGAVREHGSPGSQFDGLFGFCPGNFLKPSLQQRRKD